MDSTEDDKDKKGASVRGMSEAEVSVSEMLVLVSFCGVALLVSVKGICIV